MAAAIETPPLEDPTQLLDAEISAIKDQISLATSRRQALTSHLLLSTPIRSLSESPNRAIPEAQHKILKGRIAKAKREQQLSSHRIAYGTTQFSTRDPDPYAVDDGAVTGIRIECFEASTRKFGVPAYVFLNQPWKSQAQAQAQEQGTNGEGDTGDAARYRVHRHTLPPSVPVEALAVKYLPGPAGLGEGKKGKKQDLKGFVNVLRKEIVSLRKRQDVTEGVRRNTDEVSKIEAVNAEATDLRIHWASGEIGRLRMAKHGSIQQCIVNAEGGERRRDLERMVEGAKRIEQLAEVLRESAG